MPFADTSPAWHPYWADGATCQGQSLANGLTDPSRYEGHERRADDGCPKCGQVSDSLAHARAPSGAAASLRRRRELPRLAVHGPPDTDDLRRRAPLREAVAVDRRRTRALDPGRAVLLPRPARAARPVARLAAQLNDGRVHRREDSERDRHVR